jgi:hypothetical protein
MAQPLNSQYPTGGWPPGPINSQYPTGGWPPGPILALWRRVRFPVPVGNSNPIPLLISLVTKLNELSQFPCSHLNQTTLQDEKYGLDLPLRMLLFNCCTSCFLRYYPTNSLQSTTIVWPARKSIHQLRWEELRAFITPLHSSKNDPKLQDSLLYRWGSMCLTK